MSQRTGPTVGPQSMQTEERDTTAAFLQGAVVAGVSSDEIAALVATTFQNIDQALSPVVGQRGMAALYKRSLHLSRPLHAWLPVVAEGADVDRDLEALTAALAAQTSMDAALAGTQLLKTFRALLANLIGDSLTERLLRPVWATFLSGPSARDTKS
jgi:hypothetical protein